MSKGEIRFWIVAAAVLATVLAVGIRRELHAVHYQAALANCIELASRGVTCSAAVAK